MSLLEERRVAGTNNYSVDICGHKQFLMTLHIAKSHTRAFVSSSERKSFGELLCVFIANQGFIVLFAAVGIVKNDAWRAE